MDRSRVAWLKKKIFFDRTLVFPALEDDQVVAANARQVLERIEAIHVGVATAPCEGRQLDRDEFESIHDVRASLDAGNVDVAALHALAVRFGRDYPAVNEGDEIRLALPTVGSTSVDRSSGWWIAGFTLLIPIVIVTSPVVLPIALALNAWERRRKAAWLATVPCPACGGPLGRPAMESARRAFAARVRELRRQRPTVRFRLVSFAAMCPGCRTALDIGGKWPAYTLAVAPGWMRGVALENGAKHAGERSIAHADPSERTVMPAGDRSIHRRDAPAHRPLPYFSFFRAHRISSTLASAPSRVW